MTPRAKKKVILLAEDDEDDYMLMRDALEGAHLTNELHRVEDGEALMDYLHRRNTFRDEKTSPVPGLILLDLNMPRKDGRECLREIKADPRLRAIPIVVFTTSKAEEEVLSSYQLGANSFIQKPVSFEDLVEVMRVLGRFWFEIAEIPAPVQ